MLTALLDTCVLWPSLQRDFLLSLAIEDVYRPLWSRAILDELEYEEARKLRDRGTGPATAEARARHLISQMGRAFQDAEVNGWEHLEGTFGLPDADDEHVLAAAVTGGASVIVTHNTKDFPGRALPLGIDIRSPAQFAFDAVSPCPARALIAINAIAKRSGKSGLCHTEADILNRLTDRYGLGQAVELIRKAQRD